jgi:hypothetical protein
MGSRLIVFSVLAALIVIGVDRRTEASTTNFNVTNDGFAAFAFAGVDNPTLTLTRGQTYTFTVSALGHPFWITTARGAGDTSANAFSTGVTNNGASPAGRSRRGPRSAPR